MPAISVIIPAYNAESTILKTIESVQQQSFLDFELIIINDGSTDRTLELIDIQDSRIKIFCYENGGVSVARNRGTSHATGDFITFLDADDLWTPDKLELQIAALLKHPEAGVAYSWTCFLDEQGKSLYTANPVLFEGNVYAKLLLWNFLYSGSNPLIRRQALESVGGFDSTLTHGEDWEFYLRLAANWSFVVVPKPQVLYRQTSSSASSKIEVMEKEVLRAIEKAFLTAPLELQYLKNQSRANFYQFLAHLYLKRTPNMFGAKQAEEKLQTAVHLYLRTLLDRKTQVLLVKLLLIRLLSPEIASYLLQYISKIRSIRIKTSGENFLIS